MENSGAITIVSGLPRSGTSLMMPMLAAGGLAPLTDGQRGADPDNPRGYFELERVKKLKTDSAFFDVLPVWYHELVAYPAGEAGRVGEFVGGNLSVTKMAAAVDAVLYRQRSQPL